MLASLSARVDNDAPIGDFGFSYDEDTVRLAVIGWERFGVNPFPGGFFDQPYDLIVDAITYINIRDKAQGKTFYPDDVYEDDDPPPDDTIKGFEF